MEEGEPLHCTPAASGVDVWRLRESRARVPLSLAPMPAPLHCGHYLLWAAGLGHAGPLWETCGSLWAVSAWLAASLLVAAWPAVGLSCSRTLVYASPRVQLQRLRLKGVLQAAEDSAELGPARACPCPASPGTRAEPLLAPAAAGEGRRVLEPPVAGSARSRGLGGAGPGAPPPPSPQPSPHPSARPGVRSEPALSTQGVLNAPDLGRGRAFCPSEALQFAPGANRGSDLPLNPQKGRRGARTEETTVFRNSSHISRPCGRSHVREEGSD